MPDKEIIKARKERIDTVVDYILKNLNNHIRLQTLSKVANYSPFHFQKLFKEVMGESPKQYIIKIRLETALHLMIIHPHKSLMEISIDCGFSSPSVFSRAIKNYFGASPEEIRTLPHKERVNIFKEKNSRHIPPDITLSKYSLSKTLKIQLKIIGTLKGIYLITPFKNYNKIQQTFNELLQLATTHDLLTAHSKMLGIHNPGLENIYKAFISVDSTKTIPAKFKQTTIKGGKYASFVVKGGKSETLAAAHIFLHQWLPANGYRMTDEVSFESFSENPAHKTYQKLEREFFVPIEPL